MGLVVFAVMALYLVVAIIAVTGAARFARKHGRSGARWGLGAALVMYLIPFWDLLPTVIADKYHCANDAGFFVYKTVDRWKEQNPGVMATLSMAHLPEQYRVAPDSSFPNDRRYQLPDGTLLHARFSRNGTGLLYVEYKNADGESGTQLNERFRYSRRTEGPGLIKLSREEYVVTDIKTNEVLARQVDFRQTTKGKIWGGLGDSAWKFWFQSYDSCFKSHPQKFPNGGIHRYINSLRTDCTPERKNEREAARSTTGIVVVCR